MPTVRRQGETKFYAIVEGGPQLAAALNEMDAKVKKLGGAAALAAGGRIIADEWASRVPIGEPPGDDYPGAYQEAMRDVGAVTTRGTKTGATGTVRPAVVGVPEGSQPRLYAARLEFGDFDRAAYPSARPGFDAALDQALAAISESLANFIE